jgi:hypothetical protein
MMTVLLSVTQIPVSYAQSNNAGVFPIDSTPYGFSYSEWSAKWWQWFLAIPQDQTPADDATGERCAINQNDPDVWHLTGSFGENVERECDILSGKAILVNIIASECSTGEYPELQTEAQLRKCATEVTAPKIVKTSFDGIELQDLGNYTFTSPMFTANFPENNVFGATPGPTQAVSWGYFVMFEPPSIGRHELRFSQLIPEDPVTGSPGFAYDITYHLNIVQAEEGEPFQLVSTSTSGKFNIEVEWTPDDIGSENTFIIKIMDAGGKHLEGATYDVMLYKGNQHLDESHRSGQTASEQKYVFAEEGSYTLRIENINGSGESDHASMSMQVTPEFSLTLFALLATAFGLIVLLTRFRKNFFGSDHDVFGY